MLTLDEALARLLGAIEPPAATDNQSVSTFDALGRVLAEDVRSQVDVPPEDNSEMDGYAVRMADLGAAGAELAVAQRIPAGTVGTALQPGTAARIFTGAQVPPGADAVVMQENTEAADGKVRINVLPVAGQSIRRRGEDLTRNSTVLQRGQRLTPQMLGVAASAGAAWLSVVRRPRVAIFSTGDELVMPGEPLPPGAIYNSNRFALRALVQTTGAECTDLGIVPDKLQATRDALREAAREHDLIITTGGVSVGEEDHLRPAVQAEGALELWQIAIKPGKPLAFGRVRRGEPSNPGGHAWFVGLPGNPVSTFVTFLLAVRPLLMRMQGASVDYPRRVPMRADFDFPRMEKRREFLRVRRNDRGGLDLYGNQSSGVLTSLAWADGLVDNPPNNPIRAGDTVQFLSLAEWQA
jgi:molybdopterin molybdotransferase